MKKPLKRHEALKPLSRDHHQGLLLCWKIREGRRKHIDPERVRKYVWFFYSTQLVPHFNFEEKEVFPLLGESPLVLRVLKEHERIRNLVLKEDLSEENLSLLARELEAHIRFEERTLFMEIQDKAGETVLQELQQKENKVVTPNPEDWDDKFWERAK